MGTEGLEHLPDHLVLGVVVERFLRRSVGRHTNRQNDVAVFLARRFPHHPTDGLHHVHHRITGIEEEDRVKRRNIDAFRQTTRIGEDAADVARARQLHLQPVEELVALEHVVRAIDVVDLAGEHCTWVRSDGSDVIDDVTEQRGDLLRIFDRSREGHRTSHGRRVGSKPVGVRCGVSALCQPIPTADDLYRVGESQFIIAGKLGLERRGDELLVHRQDEHLVVAQQIGADGFAEAETMEFFTIEIRIIHGAE